jgi:cytochrome P450
MLEGEAIMTKGETAGSNPRAPGPRGHRLLGSLREARVDALGLFTSAREEYGDVVRFRFGPVGAHLICDPHDIQRVLKENHRNYSKQTRGYDALRLVIGQGLITAEDSFWLRQRRIVQPAFHRHRIAGLATMMVGAAEAMLAEWQARAQRQAPVDVAAEMMSLTLRIVAEALFGADLTHVVGTVNAALTVLLRATRRNSMSLLPVRWQRIPTPMNRRFRQAVGALDRVVYGLIEERRRHGEDRDDLLSMLMATRDEDTGERMTDGQLRDEVIGLLLAGHETSANALSWAWYLLSQDAASLRDLEAELDTVLGGRSPTVEDVPRLVQTKRVIEEAMRLFPPVWVIERRAIADDVLGGYPIPAGSMILISPYVTHRHPRYWENAERFDPTRFSAEPAAHRHPFAYLPFSGGPRQCIGNGFATMETQLILATVAQRYRLRLAPGEVVAAEPTVTLRPRDGLKMSVQPRQRDLGSCDRGTGATPTAAGAANGEAAAGRRA